MRWEYKTGQLKDMSVLNKTLNMLGDEGWELVTVDFFPHENKTCARMILKRPILPVDKSPSVEI